MEFDQTAANFGEVDADIWSTFRRLRFIGILATRPVLIDTNTYVAFMRGDLKIRKVLSTADELCLSVTVLDELLAGFAAATKEAKNREELSSFFESPRVQLCQFNADCYALIYASLRLKGQRIPTNDFRIAAGAIK
jgi:predicted nucleic acid-binding protein